MTDNTNHQGRQNQNRDQTTDHGRPRRTGGGFKGIVVMAALSLAGCASHEMQQEISRHPSPDFATEAVVIRASGRQMVCTVYLTLPGNDTDKKNQVFRGTQVQGLSVNWLAASSLVIRYHTAHVEYFQPVWKHAGHTVRLWMVEDAKQGEAPGKNTRFSITSCS